jgi:hypothetical protein
VEAREQQELAEASDQRAQLSESPWRREVVHRSGVAVSDVVEHGVDDVLADPLLAGAVHPN